MTQDEIDLENKASKERQQQSRYTMDQRRELRNAMKAELSLSNSTADSREIKARYAEMPKISPPKADLTEMESSYEDIQYSTPIASDSSSPFTGAEETAVILCVDGAPVAGTILFKAD